MELKCPKSKKKLIKNFLKVILINFGLFQTILDFLQTANNKQNAIRRLQSLLLIEQ